MAHPDVVEAAVIAVPDERWGERPCACVVRRRGIRPRRRRPPRRTSPSGSRSGGSRSASSSSTRCPRPRSASSTRRCCGPGSRATRSVVGLKVRLSPSAGSLGAETCNRIRRGEREPGGRMVGSGGERSVGAPGPASPPASASCSSPAPGSRSPGSSSLPVSSSSSCSPTARTSPTRRSPIASSIRAGKTVFTATTSGRDRRSSSHHGLMEYGSIFGHGAYLGPDFTADYLHRSSGSVRDQLGGSGLRLRAPGDDRSVPDQSLRLRHEDPADHRPSRRAPSSELEHHYLALLRQPDHSIRTAAEADQRSAADPPADGLLRLVGLGGLNPAPRPQLLLHQQLAARGAGRERAERQRHRLVGDLADRAARWHRGPVRRLRALEARLAGPRAGDAQLPLARGRRPDPGPAGDRLVLLRDGGAVPAPDPGRGHLAALPGRARTASSASTSPRCSPTTWSAPGTCSWRSSSSPPRSWPPASSSRR